MCLVSQQLGWDLLGYHGHFQGGLLEEIIIDSGGCNEEDRLNVLQDAITCTTHKISADCAISKSNWAIPRSFLSTHN